MKKVDSALIIFGATLFGYVVTFLYQWGYNSFYHLPLSIIDNEISSGKIFIVVLFIGAGLISYVYISETNFLKVIKVFLIKENYFLNQRIINLKNDRIKFVSQIVILFVTVIIGFYAFCYIDNYIGIFLLLLSLNIFFYKNGFIKLSLFFICIISFVLIFDVGHMMSFDKDKYLEVQGTNLVVITTYKGMFVLANYNTKGNAIDTDFQFINIQESKINGLKFKEIKIIKPIVTTK